MNPRRNGMGRSVAVLSVIVVVLAAALAYSYVTLENQISSLKLSGHGACLFANSEFSKTGTTLTNITLTLEQQILSDKSIIDTLNSTQPAGYLGMIATLNDEITRDANIVSSFNDFTVGPSNVGILLTFCASVSNP